MHKTLQSCPRKWNNRGKRSVSETRSLQMTDYLVYVFIGPLLYLLLLVKCYWPFSYQLYNICVCFLFMQMVLPTYTVVIKIMFPSQCDFTPEINDKAVTIQNMATNRPTERLLKQLGLGFPSMCAQTLLLPAANFVEK